MDLYGWDYTGRNIGPELHKQYRLMVTYLSNSTFTNHQTWGNYLQEALTSKMGVTSAGAVRTVKRMCENFGFINRSAFNSRTEIDSDNILTERGKIVYQASVLEQQVLDSTTLSKDKKNAALAEIKLLYEEAYCDALKNFYYDNGDGTYLSPLRATLKALKKYGRMDKWEWYLLNTFIHHDDNLSEETQLYEHIAKYRSGHYFFTMNNVIRKPKGHQYIPQYFEYAGLVHLSQRPEWIINNSSRHNSIKEEVLRSDFLTKLHGGKVNG